MYDNINSYLNCVQRAWSAQDGNLVATYISLRDKHISNRNLHIEIPEHIVERQLDQPIDEIVSAHLKVLYYLTCERKFMQHNIGSVQFYNNKLFCLFIQPEIM